MRILVLSDTHGDISRACQIYHILQKQGQVDLIIHCGDYYKDAIHMSERLGAPTVWVKGNTDGSFDENGYTIVDTECGSLLVTHGHMENVDFSQQNLYYKALEHDCCAAIFGHTHRAVSAEAGGIHLLNPGSLTRPRDGSGGTFGLIHTGPDYFRGQICRYDDFIRQSGSDVSDDGSGGSNGSGGSGGNGGPKGGSGSKPKVQGGYLRGLLNYSDRF